MNRQRYILILIISLICIIWFGNGCSEAWLKDYNDPTDITYDIRDFDSLSDAVQKIGSKKCSLSISVPVTLSVNLTTPETLAIHIEAGGSISTPSGRTLTINGLFSAPLTRVFPGSGTVTLAPRSANAIHDIWWYSGAGDRTAALRAAVVNGMNRAVNLSPGASYIISDTIVLPAGCKIEGNNASVTNNISTAKQLFSILNSGCAISNLTINNVHPDSNPKGLTLGSNLASDIAIGSARNNSWIYNTKISNITISGGINYTTAIVAGFGMVADVTVVNCTVSGDWLTDYHVEWNNPSDSAIVSPHDIQFINCRALKNAHASSQAFYIAGAYAVTLMNCSADTVVNGIYLSCGDTGVQPGKEAQYSIQGCQIAGHSAYGITMGCSDLSLVNSWYIGSKIENCYLEGSGTGGSATTTGIRIYKNKGGPVIKNNKIKNSNYGIAANSGRSIRIEGNEFDNIYYSAIHFISITDSEIINNKFKDISTNGHASPLTDVAIMLENASNRNIISNNQFGYDGQTITPFYHINVIDDQKRANWSVENRIISNIFYPTESKIMVINGGASGFGQRMYASGNRIVSNNAASRLFYGSPVLEEVAGKVVTKWTAPPKEGTWHAGDRVYNVNHVTGQPESWVCTVSGTPGRWTSEGRQ